MHAVTFRPPLSLAFDVHTPSRGAAQASRSVATLPLTLVNHERWAELVKQFIKFGIVGGSGVLVNLVVTYVMTQLNGGTTNDNRVVMQLPGRFALRYTVVVWIVAFFVANLWNFQLNRSWTFKRDQRRSWWAEFWPFLVVGSVAAFLGIFIKIALTNPTSPLYLPSPMFNDHQGLRARAYWAQLITILVTMPINYVVNKVWTFRAVRNDETPPMIAPVVAPETVVDDADTTDETGAR